MSEETLYTFKITFEIPLFLIKEVCEQAAAFDYYKYGLRISGMINRWGFQKRLYAVDIYVVSSVLYFNLAFLKYGLKILATFLACSWIVKKNLLGLT